MVKSCLAVLCFLTVQFVYGLTVDERLNELERIITLQTETLSQHESLIREQREKLETVQNENDLFKNRVEVLENAIERLHEAHHEDVDERIKPESEDDQQVVSGDDREREHSSIQHSDKQIHLLKKPQRRLALPLASTQKVAFYAHSIDNHCLHNYENLIFKVEDLDLGDGYDTSSGIYVVPVTGTYVFTWCAFAFDVWYTTQIMINGQVRGSVVADGEDGEMMIQGTGLIVCNVIAGDSVFIRRIDGHGCHVYFYASRHTTFAGWKLF